MLKEFLGLTNIDPPLGYPPTGESAFPSDGGDSETHAFVPLDHQSFSEGGLSHYALAPFIYIAIFVTHVSLKAIGSSIHRCT